MKSDLMFIKRCTEEKTYVNTYTLIYRYNRVLFNLQEE